MGSQGCRAGELLPNVAYVRSYSSCASSIAVPSDALRRESSITLSTPNSFPSTRPFHPNLFGDQETPDSIHNNTLLDVLQVDRWVVLEGLAALRYFTDRPVVKVGPVSVHSHRPHVVGIAMGSAVELDHLDVDEYQRDDQSKTWRKRRSSTASFARSRTSRRCACGSPRLNAAGRPVRWTPPPPIIAMRSSPSAPHLGKQPPRPGRPLDDADDVSLRLRRVQARREVRVPRRRGVRGVDIKMAKKDQEIQSSEASSPRAGIDVEEEKSGLGQAHVVGLWAPRRGPVGDVQHVLGQPPAQKRSSPAAPGPEVGVSPPRPRGRGSSIPAPCPSRRVDGVDGDAVSSRLTSAPRAAAGSGRAEAVTYRRPGPGCRPR